MLLLIDNYDSFTYNLVHYFGELGADVVVRRNDALNVQEAMALNPAAIVLSPGPCDPDQAGICLALTAAAAETRTPLLGVCLGHQTIGQAFGGNIVHAKIRADDTIKIKSRVECAIRVVAHQSKVVGSAIVGFPDRHDLLIGLHEHGMGDVVCADGGGCGERVACGGEQCAGVTAQPGVVGDGGAAAGAWGGAAESGSGEFVWDPRVQRGSLRLRSHVTVMSMTYWPPPGRGSSLWSTVALPAK